MIISTIILIISFLLDGIMSYYLTSNTTFVSIFSTIYTVIALVIIYKFFSNEKKYLFFCVLFGLLFDITYTNTFIFNAFLFFIIGINIILLNTKLANNIFNNTIFSLISIFLYYILSNIILIFINYTSFNTYLLFKILINSILMTIIYSLICTIIVDKLNKKFNFKIVK